MSKCIICGKNSEEVSLYDGIVEGKLNKICYGCSLNENIPLIRKPTREQLENAQKRQSVREIMEKISSPQKKIMKTDSTIAHKNLNKIKFPSPKQEHIDLVENYDWILRQARRHKKYSVAQTASLTGVDKAQIDSLESGQLFNNFEEVVKKLEKFLDVKILKTPLYTKGVIHVPKEKVEREVVEEVKQKMKKPWWNFFKKKEDKIDEAPKVETEKSQPEISSHKKIEYAEEVPKKKLSPWQEIRERQRREAINASTIRSFTKSNKNQEEPIRMNVVKSEEIQHGEIDLDEIKKSKNERKNKNIGELEKEIEQGKFDFSDKEALDKIRIQDLVELKKAREKDSKKFSEL